MTDKMTASRSVRRFLATHHPSAFLLAAQLILLLLYMIFDGLHSQRAMLSGIGGLILALVVWVVSRTPGSHWIALALAVPALVLSLLSAVVVNPGLLAWSAVLEALLYVYAAVNLIVYMMGDFKVTTDELFAAGATFTLLAWAFAYAYLACDSWLPGSFVSSFAAGEGHTFIELLSLSFTNLTATGLSDLAPISAPARVLVMLEQFTGIGYVAVVVSRLIGLSISAITRRKVMLLEEKPEETRKNFPNKN
ncbi:MAG: ion channel [Anaerolineaceae bacterium]